MIEENEIRVGLSYFERARIVVPRYGTNSETLKNMFLGRGYLTINQIGLLPENYVVTESRITIHWQIPDRKPLRAGVRCGPHCLENFRNKD